MMISHKIAYIATAVACVLVVGSAAVVRVTGNTNEVIDTSSVVSEETSDVPSMEVSEEILDTSSDTVSEETLTETSSEEASSATTSSKVSATKSASSATSSTVTSSAVTSSKSEETSSTASSEATPTAAYSASDLRYMSAIIFAEAGGECEAGQQAVGIVVMNRSASSSFANGVYNVIYQSGQFSPVTNGSLNKALAKYDAGTLSSSCIEAAKYALNGNKTVYYNGKTYNLSGYYYFSRSLSGAKLTIGNHQFK